LSDEGFAFSPAPHCQLARNWIGGKDGIRVRRLLVWGFSAAQDAG
jgi:hypothetical protein